MDGFSWEKYCELAIQYASAAGIKLTSRPRTVMEWHRCFRSKGKFETLQRKKDNLPPFLQANPDVCSAMQQYGKENLRELSIKMMAEYVHGMIIPLMIAEESKVPVEEVRGDEEKYEEAKKKMVYQLDDCVDVLNILFGQQYDFLCLFDHSCGHDKKEQMD
jgi:hypothetical protein